MTKYEIGVRKYTEQNEVQYWLMINAKTMESNKDWMNPAFKLSSKTRVFISFNFINDPYWVFFILLTILINFFISINYLPYEHANHFVRVAVIVHLTCFFYWIDFLGMLILKLLNKSNPYSLGYRSKKWLVVDAISLLPLSTFYLIIESHTKTALFWWLRSITLLRFYRIPQFVKKLTSAGRNHSDILVATYTFYLFILIDIFANLWILFSNQTYDIAGYDTSFSNFFVVAVYFSVVTYLNVGFGDITPKTNWEILLCCLAMITGFIITTGVITGAVATRYANTEKKRENFRSEYKSTMSSLKQRKIDKKVIDKISDNLQILWRNKKGSISPLLSSILPMSLQKEIYFDVNFGFLNRSLIFSLQPRSFLRSVSLMMKNMSYLPGDIIMEAVGTINAMICVASGVIEILSEENDDTPLLSFTTGTILGEATLFFPIPLKHIIRASTNVELQVLKKINFSRLALKYTEIYRSMRSDILYRIECVKNSFKEEALRLLDQDVYEMTRKKATKHLQQELKKNKREINKNNTFLNGFKTDLLNLYVLSENIPRVKTLPINLLNSKPWILRPNTTLTRLWDIFMILTITIVSFVYPCLVGFVRKVSSETYVMLFLVQVTYIIDLYIQCTTAIERKDHFTYITSIKQIIGHKLRSVCFYLDVLATYDLTIYSTLIMPEEPEYAYLLLSLNRMLKCWYIPHYFLKLENNLKRDLFMIRTIKYFLYYAIAVVWCSAILFLEACPEENCISSRWYARLQAKEVHNLDPSPSTEWPAIVSLYWASQIVSAVGYGDLVPKTILECLTVLLCIIFGVVVLTFCAAQASATLKHFHKYKTYYQEEVFAVDRFMRDHEISEKLQKDVRNYFKMQWNYDKGFSMKHHQTIEGMPAHQRDIILTELTKKFVMVPIFSKTPTEFLRLIAKTCRIRVLPPDEIIVYAGSFVRDMYFLENGYCEVLNNDNLSSLIGPLTSFGYVEMILGQKLDISVRTVTHARILSLDYAGYLRAITQYPNLKTNIESEVAKMYATMKQKENPWDLYYFKVQSNKGIIKQPVWSKAIINVYRYHTSISTNYWEPFQSWGKLRFLQFLLLPIVLSPQSIFLKIWCCFRIFTVVLMGFIAPIRYSMSQHTQQWSVFIYVLLVISWLDIYLMLHVAYYDQRGILMFHPAKTSTWYLKHSFIIDIISSFPFPLMIEALYPRKDFSPSALHDGPGFIMLLQFHKFFQGCYYLENDIMGSTPNIKIIKFITLSLLLTNAICGLLILTECHVGTFEYHGTTQNPNSMNDLQKSIDYYCMSHEFRKNHTRNTTDWLPPLKFYLVTYYWVTTTMTTCGFGDYSAYNRSTMIAFMIIIVLGLFLYGYMFASITSTMISAYNLVTKYKRRLREMSRFMKLMKANGDIQNRLILHYEYNWQRTLGASPQKMFTYVHAVLRETIVASMYEEPLRQGFTFLNAEKAIIRVIGKYLYEMYFLRGETIVAYNDIQEYIYIIYRGKVDVSSPSGFITSMGSGGLFGNISKMPYSLSSVTVVATRNVDVLRLNSQTFFKALEIFPNTKPLVEYLISRASDYIQPLQEQIDDMADNRTNVDSSDSDILPYEIVSVRIRAPFMKETELTSYKNCFYCGNAIFKFPQKKCLEFVFLHDSWFNKVVELFTMLLAYLSGTLAFYMFAFQEFSLPAVLLSYALDIMFALLIFYQFNLSYSDKYGDYVISKKKIRKRYLKQKKTLCLDIAANLPLDFLCLAVPEPNKIQVLSILRLNRILRLSYVRQFYDSKSKVLMIHKIYLKISWLVFHSGLIIHFFACIWYFITCPLGHRVEPTWATNWQLYIYSTYYVITLTTTTGYGDIKLASSIEYIAAIFFMLACRFGIAILGGSVAALMNVHSLNLFTFQEAISDFRENLLRQNISNYQMIKIWKYVTTLWLRESGKQIPKFIANAPHVMKCEVMYSMFGHHLSQSYIFWQMEEPFLKQLASFLRRFIYFPGNYIVQQGDIDHTMYFIHKGLVSVLTIHPNLTETIHFKLQESDYFGMTQGLVVGTEHYFSYRAESEVEILSLTLNHWQSLLKYFPEMAQKIYQRLKSLPLKKEVNPRQSLLLTSKQQ